MIFVPFIAMSNSFADRSPPGVEISIDYDVLTNIDLLNIESGEARIAVFDSDLKLWPVNQTVNKSFKNDCYYLIITKAYANQTMLVENDPNISDQVSKPVNKHGVADKEVCYPQNRYSYFL